MAPTPKISTCETKDIEVKSKVAKPYKEDDETEDQETYLLRSHGVGASGIRDQYADGIAARVWEYYIGNKDTRTEVYKTWITECLKNKQVSDVLDVACGTGVDSIMLINQGFNVLSCDASDKMLKYALKTRWDRRKEPAFDNWNIEEANWLTLPEDINHIPQSEEGFDAVICLGNSFAHLPDFEGTLNNQKIAIANFHSLLKPGGILVIDHRNYDAILGRGNVPTRNVYYNSEFVTNIKVSNLYVDNKPTMVTLDYEMDMAPYYQSLSQAEKAKLKCEDLNRKHKFRLSYYPHRLEHFTNLLKEIFGENANHERYGDFEALGKIETPAYYIHVIQKPK